MSDAQIDTALITDDNTVHYLTGYYDYLNMEFGRPTILIIYRDGPSLLVAIQPNHMPPTFRAHINKLLGYYCLVSPPPILSQVRMIKTAQVLQLARHAIQVADAMMSAGRNAFGHGVPEFEVANATSQAGTRKAAELLRPFQRLDMSPNTYFLQIKTSSKTDAPQRGTYARARRAIGLPKAEEDTNVRQTENGLINFE